MVSHPAGGDVAVTSPSRMQYDGTPRCKCALHQLLSCPNDLHPQRHPRMLHHNFIWQSSASLRPCHTPLGCVLSSCSQANQQRPHSLTPPNCTSEHLPLPGPFPLLSNNSFICGIYNFLQRCCPLDHALQRHSACVLHYTCPFKYPILCKPQPCSLHQAVLVHQWQQVSVAAQYAVGANTTAYAEMQQQQ